MRLRDRDGFDLRQSRVRNATREERCYEDYDTGSELSFGRYDDWRDRNHGDIGYVTEQKRRLHYQSRRSGRIAKASRADSDVYKQQQRELPELDCHDDDGFLKQQ